MKIERGAARHQHVDAVAEDALDRVGNLALKVRPHDEVETLTGGMFDRESIFFAETAPTDFSSPVKEIALFLGHLAAHHQNLVVNALKDARHRAHIGWVDRVQVIGDMGYTARESQLCAGGKRMRGRPRCVQRSVTAEDTTKTRRFRLAACSAKSAVRCLRHCGASA